MCHPSPMTFVVPAAFGRTDIVPTSRVSREAEMWRRALLRPLVP